MAIRQDLPESKIGDTLIQVWQFLNETDSTPIAQEGFHYTFTLKLNRSALDADADIFHDLIVPAGVDADAGGVVIRIEKSETALLLPTTYNYELKQILSGAPEDTEITLLDGKMKMEY